jgi:[acyl-carrier-protein] S-malonyltransferase
MKKFVAIFPGQGSQSTGMGRDFYEQSDIAKEMIENASDRLKIDFKELLFEQNDKLELTQYTQPAILLVSAIAYRLFEDRFEIKPVCGLGHSLGEFSALVATKALDYLDGVELVHKRGELMSKACEGKEASMMALIGLNDEKAEEICKEARDSGKRVWAAYYNADGQIVIAGLKNDLQSLIDTFKSVGAKRALLLNMSIASHCELISSATKPFGELLEEYLRDDFAFDIISNVNAKPYNTKKEAVKLLQQQLISAVLYKQSIKNIDNDTDIFIEFGGNVLKGINRRVTKKPTYCIADMNQFDTLQEEFEK